MKLIILRIVMLICLLGKLVFELPNNLDRKVANPMQNSTLDGQKLMDLGWRCLLSPQVGLEHTINQLKELY